MTGGTRSPQERSPGTAGARRAADAPRPARRPLAALAAAVLALPVTLLAPPAAAAPGPVAPDDAGDPDRPVAVDLTRLEPRTVSPGVPVTVAGTITNTGEEAVTDLDVRLQRGEQLTSRAALVAAETDDDPATAAATPFTDLPGELAPGDSTGFSLTTTAEELGIAAEGVYPLVVNLNGVGEDGERQRVGELTTWLVQPPAQPAVPTGVAWLWPLTERTHRDAAGRFVDDGLAAAVSPGGRLDRALAAVERIPETAAVGAEPAPVARVTLAVDPALVEELGVMAAGPYDVAGREDAGEGTEEAGEYLDRLRAVAAEHDVLALPYGDVDADSLTAAGLSQVLTRSLPGAAGDGATGEGAAGGTAEPGGAPDAEQPPVAGVGSDVLGETLDVEPRTDLAWAVGAALAPDTLATLRAGGVGGVVVPAGALDDGTAALGLTGEGAAARTTVPGADGEVPVLVSDPRLGPLPTRDGGGLAEGGQRFLAELALLTLAPAPGGTAGQTVLVAPPRALDVDPATAAALIADPGVQPWLRSLTLGQLADGPRAGAGELVVPVQPGGLPLDGLADLAAAVAVREDLAGAVAEDPATALAPYDEAIARAASAAWRDEPDGFRALAAGTRATLEALREDVTLLAPAEGSYSLASSEAPLVLTVQNDLPFAVRVLLEVRARGNAALTVEDIGPQVLAPEQRTTLQVPAQVRQSGRFGVVATLTTPGGVPLGDPVELQVKSTAYGSISLAITIGAAALLALLFLRRLVRFLVRRRRGTPEADDALPLPPTRSPV
ncbi:DUF6049 family protein [Geodermatophilus marinus]|uniref:DUF6049 family protein n=1 Tax=Geodermatophilus sp. LHW52908 TaxID=2303986 RepID=UPI000E3E7B4D|nr:DUF6049 family protein [Geodermatophilus sp. LHW52908]RFU21013.1 hypothetical protein D0Z06_13060 [Geodermatophilus sp. LHW52908]